MKGKKRTGKQRAGNPYGYQVDISHPDILPLYWRYKKWKGIPRWCPLSDEERKEFEAYILGRRKSDGC